MADEKLAHLAEITIQVIPHGGTYSAGEVNALLAKQRKIIADRLRTQPVGEAETNFINDVKLLEEFVQADIQRRVYAYIEQWHKNGGKLPPLSPAAKPIEESCKLCAEGIPLKEYLDGTMRHFDGFMAWTKCTARP